MPTCPSIRVQHRADDDRTMSDHFLEWVVWMDDETVGDYSKRDDAECHADTVRRIWGFDPATGEPMPTTVRS